MRLNRAANLQQAAAELMRGVAIEPAPLVDLLDSEPLEIELAATLLYGHCHYSYRQIRAGSRGRGRSPAARDHRSRACGIAASTMSCRVRFRPGKQFRFDILMDIGGFRDMHRHRRCIQIMQDFTTAHGYDTPPEVDAAGIHADYAERHAARSDAVKKLPHAGGNEARENSQYAIPLAFRKRTLFKMDFAEAVYISELRTTPAGHASYRNVAYAMYEAVARKHPALAKYFRVHDVREPVDLLKR